MLRTMGGRTKFISETLSEQMLNLEMEIKKNVGFVNIRAVASMVLRCG